MRDPEDWQVVAGLFIVSIGILLSVLAWVEVTAWLGAFLRGRDDAHVFVGAIAVTVVSLLATMAIYERRRK